MKKIWPKTLVISVAVILGTSGALLATQMSDRIESSAKKSYVFMTYLKGDDIKFKTTDDSTVTLSGTVSEWSHRTLAEETVAGLPGVLHVDNRIDFKGAQTADNSDTWIGMKVRMALLFHINLSTVQAGVTVVDGAVALHGKASNTAQKELITEYVSDIDGVKSVKNHMSIMKNEKSAVEKVTDQIDDASITAQVKIALLFHRSTNVIQTKIETNNGDVTVKGVAKNSDEKELVRKLVSGIKGVKSLKNEMTIE